MGSARGPRADSGGPPESLSNTNLQWPGNKKFVMVLSGFDTALFKPIQTTPS